MAYIQSNRLVVIISVYCLDNSKVMLACRKTEKELVFRRTETCNKMQNGDLGKSIDTHIKISRLISSSVLNAPLI